VQRTHIAHKRENPDVVLREKRERKEREKKGCDED
jgi:hypothetical protein